MLRKLQNGIGRVLSWIFYCIMGILLLLGLYAVIHWFSFSKPSGPIMLHSFSLPMLCTDAPEDGLTVTRSVNMDLSSNSYPTIRDSYTLENSTGQEMELTLYYPRICEASRLTNTVIFIDDEPQAKTYYSSASFSLHSRQEMGTALVDRLRGYFSGGDLEQALETPIVQTGPTDGADNTILLSYLEVTVVIPAESDITLTAQWRDRWADWTKEEAETYRYTLSFVNQVAGQLPCEAQTITLSNYDGIELTHSTFAIDLEQKSDSSLFTPNSETETISYKLKG